MSNSTIEIPLDPSTVPHKAIAEVIQWLGVGYETTVTRRSDGKRFVIAVKKEKEQQEAGR